MMAPLANATTASADSADAALSASDLADDQGGSILGQLVDLGAGAPNWLTYSLRSIRPVCVGALMAIPTLGAATVGVVAAFSPSRATAMVAASTAFLNGIPADVLLLIGTLATGYGLAKTFERVRVGRA